MAVYVKGRDDIGLTNVTVGTYRMVFRIGDLADVAPIEWDHPFIEEPLPGKRVEIQRASLDNGKLVIQVRVLDNPIPLLLLIGVAAAGIGVAGWGVSESLDRVDQIINSPTIYALGAATLVGVLWYTGLLSSIGIGRRPA